MGDVTRKGDGMKDRGVGTRLKEGNGLEDRSSGTRLEGGERSRVGLSWDGM